MSSWGAFGLICNDGKIDNLITATKLLNQRIKDIMCARAKAGMADTSPTLVDIERTHILYINAHFKPYAAIGFEYNKVRTQSGSAAFGSGVTFSIPQFGDFFHDMVCRVVLGQVQAASAAVPTVPVTAGVTSQFYNLLSNLPVVAATTTYQNLVRYCEYPGNRLFKNVKFDVNGNPIDQYDTTIPIMLEKFCVPVNKRTGYDRLIGQEVAVEGYKQLSLDVVYDGDAKNTPAGKISSFTLGQSNQTVGLFSTADAGQSFTNTTLNAAGNAIGAVGAAVGIGGLLPTTAQGQFFGQYNVSREQVSVVCGPQTPKPIQPPLEIWNKLRFWFNDDVRLSIASVSIPFGQRYISIDLANQNELVYEVASIGYSLIGTAVDPPVNPYVSVVNNSTSSVAALSIAPTQITPYLNQNGLDKTQSISTMELYINNIFVNPEIHDIYIKRIGFSLIRVYRYQTQSVSANADEVLLSNLKWPIEYMFVGLRPKYNVTAPSTSNSTTAATVTTGNPNIWRDWHRLTRMVDAVNADGMANFVGGTAYGGTAGATSISAGSFPPGLIAAGTNGIPQPATSAAIQPLGNNLVSSFGSKAAQYWLPVPTVDTLGLSSHGITVYDGYSDKFFNQYAPFHYGGAALNTPEDVGALFVNLCLFPRSYQPSGHLNISRARETYLRYTSTYIGSNSTADMLVVGVAINFLLITDGSAVLRYST